MELCAALGIAIPVGKDSMSMKTVWRTDAGERREMTAPLSLIVSAFAPVSDVRRTLTPQLRTDQGDTDLILIDLGHGKNRLGGSCLAQVFDHLGSEGPDLDHPDLLKRFFAAIQELRAEDLILAYHDRSDGGLLATLCEMAFAGRCGVDVDLAAVGPDDLAALFSEELGAVIQVRHTDTDDVLHILDFHGLAEFSPVIGMLDDSDQIRICRRCRTLFEANRADLQQAWSETSYPDAGAARPSRLCRGDLRAHRRARPRSAMPSSPSTRTTTSPRPISSAAPVRRSPSCATRASTVRSRWRPPSTRPVSPASMSISPTSSPGASISPTSVDWRPAAASPTATCWARARAGPRPSSSTRARAISSNGFFERGDTFTLGICNGCQMLSNLRELIPGSEHWPHFVRNRSEQFEARTLMLEVAETPSVLLAGMAGSRMPIAVAHGEGRAEFRDAAHLAAAEPWVIARYVENDGRVAALVPGQPQRLAQGHRRPHNHGWARHHHDAAPGAGLPDRAKLLASRRLGPGRALDAAVPQCAGLGGVIGLHTESEHIRHRAWPPRRLPWPGGCSTPGVRSS